MPKDGLETWNLISLRSQIVMWEAHIEQQPYQSDRECPLS